MLVQKLRLITMFLLLDGNHLAGTEHRPAPTRTTRAAALPGQALVVDDRAGGPGLEC